MKTLALGIIGYGQIARRVIDAVAHGAAGDCRVEIVLVRHHRPTPIQQTFKLTTDAQVLISSDVHAVVELAGHDALREYGGPVLSTGKDLVAMSVGAFADSRLFDELSQLAMAHHCRLIVPSGAIGGLDILSSAVVAGLTSVTHTTRKNPRSFASAHLPKDLEEPRILFDGPAREGIRLFPENVNVAAAVSLAGVGFDRTRLRVIADPQVQRNRHTLEFEGRFGRAEISVENTPMDNGKTSLLAALSVIKTLRDLTSPVVIGR